MKAASIALRFSAAYFLFALTIYSQAQQSFRYNVEYRCNGERVVIGHCRSQDDRFDLPRTPPDRDYCSVYYPDRPKYNGFPIQTSELRGDVIKKLQDCGALAAPGTSGSTTSNPGGQRNDQVSAADAAAYNGRQRYKEKDYKTALELFNRAIALDPDNEMAYRGLAQMNEDLKQWPRVIAARKKLAELKPNDDSNLTLLGDAQRQAKLYDDALATFARAIRLKPDAGDYYLTGLVYNETKQYDKAVSAFQSALRLNPKHANANYNLGVAFYNLQQYPKAIEAFQQALNLKVGNPHFVYGWTGDAYYNQKQFDKAIAPYKEAVRLKPDYDYALNQLGVCHYVLKQYAEALVAYQTAVRLKPTEAGYQLNLGDTYVKLGRKEDALAIHKKLQTLDPPMAKELLSRINKNNIRMQ